LIGDVFATNGQVINAIIADGKKLVHLGCREDDEGWAAELRQNEELIILSKLQRLH
jgi:hypothetical protein